MWSEQEVSSQILNSIDAIIDAGYGNLTNFECWKEDLRRSCGPFFELGSYVLGHRPSMSICNLIHVIAGALNLQLTRAFSITTAARVMSDPESLRQFINDNQDVIRATALSRNNTPTIPQRGVTVSLGLEPNCDWGVLELGCSRGDNGLVLLNLEQLLRRSDWQFSGWNPDKHRVSPINVSRYYGVDLDADPADDWLLSLWGLEDPRRERLASFYRQYPASNTERFRRKSASALDFDSYINECEAFFSEVDRIAVLTSFMVYQVATHERIHLIATIREIIKRFEDLTETKAIWVQQGLPPEHLMRSDCRFDNVVLSRIQIESNHLQGTKLYQLSGDDCQNWWPMNEQIEIELHQG